MKTFWQYISENNPPDIRTVYGAGMHIPKNFWGYKGDQYGASLSRLQSIINRCDYYVKNLRSKSTGVAFADEEDAEIDFHAVVAAVPRALKDMAEGLRFKEEQLEWVERLRDSLHRLQQATRGEYEKYKKDMTPGDMQHAPEARGAFHYAKYAHVIEDVLRQVEATRQALAARIRKA